MCIAVPDRCILAESNQLIKYLSPSNSQSEALIKAKIEYTWSLCHAAQIGWPFLVGVACQTKNVHFAGVAPPTTLLVVSCCQPHPLLL